MSDRAKNKNVTLQFSVIPLLVVVVVSVISVVVVKDRLERGNNPKVLGNTVYLADHGSDDSGGGGGGDHGGGGGGGGSSGGGGSGSSGSGGDHGGSGGDSGDNRSSGGSISGPTDSSVGENSLVDCVGPDGKHLQTTKHACGELNNAWHKSDWSFNKLSTTNVPSEIRLNKEKTEIKREFEERRPNGLELENKASTSAFLGKRELEVKTEVGKTKIKVNTLTTKFELENYDNELKIKAKDDTGLETELEDNTLEEINESLKDKDLTVGTSSAGFTLKNGEVEAETKFPLALNLAKDTLTINTPAGEREVAVLPEQAVSNLLGHKIVNRLTTVGTGSANLQLTTTGANSEPVFHVSGVLDKKLFGLFPISIDKTMTVSAQSGQTLQVIESPLNQVLEIFSF